MINDTMQDRIGWKLFQKVPVGDSVLGDGDDDGMFVANEVTYFLGGDGVVKVEPNFLQVG